MAATVLDISRAMEAIAAGRLAEEWDNCGLQVGQADWPVKRIWTALDPSHEVIAAAVDSRVDMVVTHHPLIFRPISRLDAATPVGRVIATALANRLAIFTAHTNLDAAAGGVNDVLAHHIGLRTVGPLQPILAAHPADHPAGMGRICELPEPIPLDALARQTARRLDIATVRVAGPPELLVDRCAICSGSGSSLMTDFFMSDAQVYISGDLKYHDARDAEAMGRGVIDIGHFASEHLVVRHLAERLTSLCAEHRWAVTVDACRLERDPFRQIDG